MDRTAETEYFPRDSIARRFYIFKFKEGNLPDSIAFWVPQPEYFTSDSIKNQVQIEKVITDFQL